MTASIDHLLDTDQALLFKSSDGKTFGLSKGRARLSSVWRDMIDLGSEEVKITEVVTLDETEERLIPFFDVLGVYCGAKDEFPKDLEMSVLISLLRLAEKYQTFLVRVFVQHEIQDGISSSSDGTFKGTKMTNREILLLFYYAEALEMKRLVTIAAKLSFQIKDLILDVPSDLDSFITRRDHLAPLHKLRNQWEKKRKEILDGPNQVIVSSSASGYDSKIGEIGHLSTQTAQQLLQEDHSGSTCHCLVAHPHVNDRNGVCAGCGHPRRLTAGKLLLLIHAFDNLELEEKEAIETGEATEAGEAGA